MAAPPGLHFAGPVGGYPLAHHVPAPLQDITQAAYMRHPAQMAPLHYGWDFHAAPLQPAVNFAQHPMLHRRTDRPDGWGMKQVQHANAMPLVGIMPPQAPTAPGPAFCFEPARSLPEEKHTVQERIVEPDSLLCPIMQVMYIDPCFVPESGNTYERSALERFWKTLPKPRDPLTNMTLSSTQTYPNWGVRREIQRFLEDHPDYVPQGWTDRHVPQPEQAPMPSPSRNTSQLRSLRTVLGVMQRIWQHNSARGAAEHLMRNATGRTRRSASAGARMRSA